MGTLLVKNPWPFHNALNIGVVLNNLLCWCLPTKSTYLKAFFIPHSEPCSLFVSSMTQLNPLSLKIHAIHQGSSVSWQPGGIMNTACLPKQLSLWLIERLESYLSKNYSLKGFRHGGVLRSWPNFKWHKFGCFAWGHILIAVD